MSFISPFFDAVNARRAADGLQIPLHVVDFTAEILALVQHPPHGYGSGLNPCIDCHAAMLKRAGRLMEAQGGHLLATGEVLDQRPMSQNRQSLDKVARHSGYAGWVLRPLSAQCLDETEPERRGWVDRSRLLGLSGRNRKPQIELARRYGIVSYPTPAGGCRLTEPNYSGRLRDLMTHEGLGDLRLIELLRVGRHFRLGEGVRLIVGRNEADNRRLEELRGAADLRLTLGEIPGPTCLLCGPAEPAHVKQAAALAARYSDAAQAPEVAVTVTRDGCDRVIRVAPAREAEGERLRIT